ncbi:MAG TPA: hypothetical protein PLN54_04700 [Flavobacteriales bacterium]|nr:hypothetical protein [Flavobacteriales bacterium]
MEAYMNYQMEGRPSSLDSALNFIDQAISCDTNKFGPFHNKINILIDVGRYQDAINIIGETERRFPPIPFYTALKAICFYRLGDSLAFEFWRDNAIDASESRLELLNKREVVLDILMIRCILYGKSSAFELLDNLKRKGINEVDYTYYKEWIEGMQPFESTNSIEFQIEPSR